MMQQNDVMLTSFTATDPLSTVPVMTVPWPRMGKQWSTENTNGPMEERFGMNTLDVMTCLQFIVRREKLNVSSPCTFLNFVAFS